MFASTRNSLEKFTNSEGFVNIYLLQMGNKLNSKTNVKIYSPTTEEKMEDDPLERCKDIGKTMAKQSCSEPIEKQTFQSKTVFSKFFIRQKVSFFKIKLVI